MSGSLAHYNKGGGGGGTMQVKIKIICVDTKLPSFMLLDGTVEAPT